MPIFQVRKLSLGGVEGIVQPSQDSHPGLQTLCHAGKTFYRNISGGANAGGCFPSAKYSVTTRHLYKEGAWEHCGWFQLGRGLGQNETLVAQGALTGKEEFPRMHCR